MSLLFLFFSLAMSQSDTTFRQNLTQLLPTSINRWKISEPPRFCTGSEIFDYMDGAGEVYLAYKYQHLLAERYSAPGQEEILVEIFDMGNSRNAFGIFTYMKGRGPEYPIGQEAEYKSGLLCFWKGQYFVYVHIDNENNEVREAVLELGRRISDTIREEGNQPAIVHILPEGIYIPSSLRYFYRYEILNSHFYVASSNIFHLNDQVEGILVQMRSGKTRLLLISYPSEQMADSAYHNFISLYLPEAKEKAPVQMENMLWTSSIRQVRYLAVVFDASTQKEAADFLETVRRRLP